MRKIPQTPWKTDATAIIPLGSKFRAWRPASRREGRMRGTRKANGSIAAVLSRPAVCGAGCAPDKTQPSRWHSPPHSRDYDEIRSQMTQ
jgi:hypothetical protein